MEQGACKGNKHVDFFPTNGHFLLTRPAKEICNACPVMLDCLAYALEHRIDHGVWGGTDEAERRRIRKARNRPLRLA
jgi:WhiB family redox-sensing transcriptional regulator